MTGDHLTIADVQLVTFLNLAFRVTLTVEQRKHLKSLVEYFVRVALLPEFVKYNGRPHFTTSEYKSVTLTAENKKKETHKDAQKKDAPKKDAPKKEAQKKEEPKKKKEEKEEEEEEDVHTGPVKWNLYDYKTLYTNAKNKEEAI